jgi:mono/diheme cytochrome c family protein
MPNLELPRRRFQIGILILIGLLLGFGNMAFAQEKEVKKVPVQTSRASSGADMYKQYCAACHGAAGKGDGPAASALKQAPADLTTLAQRHNGKFPDDYVTNVLRNGVKAPAHGDAEMPVWGPLFSSMDQNDAVVNLRIANLTKYIKSLQVK